MVLGYSCQNLQGNWWNVPKRSMAWSWDIWDPEHTYHDGLAIGALPTDCGCPGVGEFHGCICVNIDIWIYLDICNVSHWHQLRPLQKWPIFCGHFQMHIIKRKIVLAWMKWPTFCEYIQSHITKSNILYFDWNFTEVCAYGSNWQ